MPVIPRARCPAIGAILVLLALLPQPAATQTPPKPFTTADSVTIAAGPRYKGGGLRRFLLGRTYRDLWAVPIRVPMLDLDRFAGGLTPKKTGGGHQTRSLHLVGADGLQYVFRLIDKASVPIPKGTEGSVIEAIARDQVSAHHPGAAVAAAELLRAAGVLHVTPMLAVMPDDPRLGEFRKEFAGSLGAIEELPAAPDDAPGFAGASAIIASDSLRILLDQAPALRLDSRALLRARLADMFLNDWDRHPGNWMWAQFDPHPGAEWVALPRDRDKPFIQFGGIVAAAGRFSANLVGFKASYPGMRSLTWNSLDMDRRLLSWLERPAWDSIATELEQHLTDPSIDAAVRMLPPEYQALRPDFGATLRARRDGIPALAGRFYLFLAQVPELHGTDSADRARIIRREDGSVEVRLLDDSNNAYLQRRFRPGETSEIRLYLHGGDDQAVITGAAATSIPVRIIGGNGVNRLIDSSSVGGQRNPTHLYDVGPTSHVRYGPDTLWSRRPWVHDDGKTIKPGPDRGGRFAPALGLGVNGDLGVLLTFGVNRYRYGFRTTPYASRTSVIGEYATGVSAFRVTAAVDYRHEGSPLHFTARARMSEFEVVHYHGLGNATPDGPAAEFRVSQRQWQLQPALAYRLSDRSDISLGPVLQFSTTDAAVGTLLSTTRPYGSGDFGQVGMRLGLFVDKRDQPKNPRDGVLVDVSGTWYPGLWDVRTPFGVVAAGAAAYFTLPVPLRPVLLLRGVGRKVFGEFPYFESAFLGGRGSVRRLDLQRYAGDASLTATTELQIPLVKFPLILPVDIGVYGFADLGRVYVGGASPGGWHRGTGVGFWFGILNPSTAINLELGDRKGSSLLRVRTGLNF